MRIYIATSWRNEELANILALLLRRHGHEVDCFCDKSTGRYCFKWSDHFARIEECDIFRFLSLPEARQAFLEDKKYIDWCEAVHLEGGYAKGSGKRLFIWGYSPNGYFENMYGFADGIFRPDDLGELMEVLNGGSVKMKHDPQYMPITKIYADYKLNG